MSSPDEGYAELNVSGFMNSNNPDYIQSDNKTPTKKNSGSWTRSGLLKQWHNGNQNWGGLAESKFEGKDVEGLGRRRRKGRYTNMCKI